MLVVRGDHVAELGADAELARLAERGLHLVAPLAGERLREAVEGPAQVAGLRLEPGWSTWSSATPTDSPAPCRCSRTPSRRPGSAVRPDC